MCASEKAQQSRVLIHYDVTIILIISSAIHLGFICTCKIYQLTNIIHKIICFVLIEYMKHILTAIFGEWLQTTSLQ